jgi:hypothetical protein
MYIAWLALALATPVWRVPVQGTVIEPTGAVNGPRTLTLTLYADEAMTTQVFAQTFSVDLVDGAFAVTLAAEPSDGVPHLGVHPRLFLTVRLAGGAPSAPTEIGEAARATWSRDADRLDGLDSAAFLPATWRPAWSDLQGSPASLTTAGAVTGGSFASTDGSFGVSSTGALTASSFALAGPSPAFSVTNAGAVTAASVTGARFALPGGSPPFSVDATGALAAASLTVTGALTGGAVTGTSFALTGGSPPFSVTNAGALTAASITTAGAGSFGTLSATSITAANLRITGQGTCSAAGTLGWASNTLHVCDGTSWKAIVDASSSSATNKVVDFQYAQRTDAVSLPGNFPWDNTIPQITEGSQVLQLTITPKATGNLLKFEGVVNWSEPSNTANYFTIGAFRVGTSNALATWADAASNGNGRCTANGTYTQVCSTPIRFVLPAPDTTAQTYTLRVGLDGGSVFINQGESGQRLGGTLTTSFSVMEIRP